MAVSISSSDGRWTYDLWGRGGTPESGRSRPASAFCVKGECSPPHLVQRAGKEKQQLEVALRLPRLDQVGLGHLGFKLVWLREQSGQTGNAVGQQGGTWPKPQQFLYCVYRLEEYTRSIVRDQEKSLIEDPRMGTWPGLPETMTEVADLPALDSKFQVRYLAERIWMFFKLRIETARLGMSSSGSSERKASGKEWIAS